MYNSRKTTEAIFAQIDEAELTPARALGWTNLFAALYEKFRVAEAAAGVALFAAYTEHRSHSEILTTAHTEAVLSWREAASVTDEMWQGAQTTWEYEEFRQSLAEVRDPDDHVMRSERLVDISRIF